MDDRLLTTTEVEKMLGVSHAHLYNMMRAGKIIPAFPDEPFRIRQKRRYWLSEVRRVKEGRPREKEKDHCAA